jgi:prolyl 4-hydroxylase
MKRIKPMKPIKPMKTMKTLLIIIILIIFILICIYMCKYVYNNTNTNNTDNTVYVDKQDYDIIEILNFLTYEECDKIIELSKGKMVSSKVYKPNEDLLDNKTRISEQCWLKDNDPFIKNISDKVKSYTNTHSNYLEDLQVVNYKPGGFFKPHYDACVGNKADCERLNKDGTRYLTVLFYLNDNLEGGETIFPKINKLVKPEKGKAVIFQNVDHNGAIITQSLHGGEPVKHGEKWIANKWIKQ